MNNGPSEPIAIIGVGCRFPGADGPTAFWRLLRDGRHAIVEVPTERWGPEVYDPDPSTPGTTNSRWGGFLERVDGFDDDFFGIPAREAAAMDPQQRLLLEVAWEALEDAGLAPGRVAGGRVGVFNGIMYYDYGHLLMSRRSQIDALTGPGISLAVSANRISYHLDLRGPSLAVDTACSSSLVSVFLACESLRRGECDLALAGGVSLMLTPTGHIFFAKAGILSPDGRCRTLDAGANGIVRGEGAGLVVLKPLARAVDDGDRIYAVLLGGAMNHDGASNGLMAPNRPAQEALLRRAYEEAGVGPGQTQYVELHGTATLLGDLIEATALGSVLATGRPTTDRCAVGSVKTNLGHLESAAGIAGLIKVALMLHHRELVPSLHFETPNPHIPFDRLPIVVQREAAPWSSPDRPALAGVSGFGFGGTNVHLVLRGRPEAVAKKHTDTPAQGPYLLTLSARSAAALRATANELAGWLRRPENHDVALTDVCAARNAGRQHHDHRLATVADGTDDLVEELEAFSRGREPRIGTVESAPTGGARPVFVFSGQGPQRPGMGRELLAEDVFREAIEACDRHFAAYAPWSLREELAAAPQDSRLDRTDIAQAALFALQVGLAALWRSWGARPTAVIGHSLGEIAAAHVAGALSLADAVLVVHHRGRLMQRTAGRGGMAAVQVDARQALDILRPWRGRLALAAINGPRSVVLSGEIEALSDVLARLTKDGIPHRRLAVDYAFHGPQTAALKNELAAALRNLEPRATEIPVFSTVTGTMVAGEDLDARHWARQLAAPVRFVDAVVGALDKAPGAFLELGPDPVLATDLGAILAERGVDIPVLPSLRQGGERASCLDALGALYARGLEVDWRAFHPAAKPSLSLPSYPWQRRRCWLPEPPAADIASAPGSGGRPLLRSHTRLVRPAGAHVWDFPLDRTALAYLDDHRIQGAAVMPGAAYVEMALSAFLDARGPGLVELSGLQLPRALYLTSEPRRLQVVLSPDSDGRFSVDVASSVVGSDADPVLHAFAHLRQPEQETAQEAPTEPSSTPLPTLRRRITEERSPELHYRDLASCGFDYGPSFRAIRRLWLGEGESLARLEVAGDVGSYSAHPVLLDTALQVLMAAVPSEAWSSLRGAALMATGVDAIRWYAPLEGSVWNHSRLRTLDDEGLSGDIRFYDPDGHLLVEVLGARATRLDRLARDETPDGLYEIRWLETDRLPEPRTEPGTWVVCGDAGAVEILADLIDRRGGRALQAAGRDALAETLDRAGGELRGVVYLAVEPRDDPTEAAALCDEVSTVLRALSRSPSPARLWVVTAGVQPVAGETPTESALCAAPLWGLGRAIAAEQPDRWGGLVDLPSGFPAAGPGSLEDVSLLLATLIDPSDEDLVAFRDGRRFVARLVPSPIMEHREEEGTELQLAKGTVLITGGLGGLGLAVARHLAEQGARHLVLLSRRGVAEPGALAALATSGAQARVVAADVADEGRLKEVLADLRRDGWPPIRGVVHAAGVAWETPASELDRATLDRQLRPKVDGAWRLHRLTSEIELDFLVFFSSASSLLPSHALGLGAYAAGNAFLDALAHHRRGRGLTALSVNWGPWSEVGMAAERSEALAAQGIGSIAPATGIAILDRLLRGSPEPEIAVAPMSWRRWRRLHPTAASQPFLSDVRPPPTTDEKLPGAVDERVAGEPLEVSLIRIIAPRLPSTGRRLEPDRPLVELGLNSLAAVTIKHRIDAEWSVDVPVIRLLKGASVAELAAWITDQLERRGTETGSTAETRDPQETGQEKRDEASEPSPQRGPRPLGQRAVQKLMRLAIRLLARIETDGLERFPSSGPVIIAYNHLSKLDKVGLIAYPSRRCALLAAGFARYRPRLRRFLDLLLDAIFIDRGLGDVEALDQALATLAAGSALSLSPEGEISDTGGLMEAKIGVAVLATRSGAPVLPVAAWGHEQALRSWRRGRRVPVRLRIGTPIRLPAGEATPDQLQRYTDEIMIAIARLLPERYRGVYAERSQLSVQK